MKNNLLKRCLKLSISVPLPSFITRLLDFSCLFRFSRQLIVFSSIGFKCRQKKIQSNKKPNFRKRNIFSRENASKPIMLARYIFLLLHVFLRSCGLDINNGQMLNGHYTLLYAPFPFLWHFCGGADSNSWGCQERLKLMKFWRSDSIICSHVLFLLLLVAIRST